MITRLLAGNARFVTNEFEAHPEYYDELLQGQNPEVLWIGCSDSRVSVDHITDSRPGMIFVHRNVANMIAFNDNNFGAVLYYALGELGIRTIVVCGHTFCGGLKALVDGTGNHVIRDWLNVGRRALISAQEHDGYAEMSEDEKMEVLTRLHVKQQIGHLERFAVVRELRASGTDLWVHGLIYDFRTGRLREA